MSIPFAFQYFGANTIFDKTFNYDKQVPEKKEPVGIFEAAEEDEESLTSFSNQQIRAMGMASAMAWVENKEFTYADLDAIVVGMIDLDGDGEVSDDEEDDYNDLLSAVGNALVQLGGSAANVSSFFDEEDDEQGKKLGRFIADKLDSLEMDNDEIVSRFATASGEEDIVFESVKKVIRNGAVTFKRKRVKKYRMSPAQKAALKAARRRANTAGARRNRAKSMRIRKQHGMK